jgi:hypothetical protein
VNCFHCGREIEVRERVGFRDTCPGCDRPIHACLNCEFYDPTCHNECRETMAERVVDKDRANFCEYFAPAKRARSARASAAKTGQSQLDALFRKK